MSIITRTITYQPEYLPARQVWERYGVTQMTLWRWLHDERMSFPKPVYFGRLRFFKLADIEAWEQAQAAKSREAA